jgi:ferric-dicitrate binding protein FerR (iron transport regulator)
MMRDDLHKETYLEMILSHLTGNLSGDSLARLHDWLNESEANRDYFNEFKKTWDAMPIASANRLTDAQKAFLLFKGKTADGDGRRSRRMKKQWLYAAAILLPFLFMSYFTYQYFRADVLPEMLPSLTEVIVPQGSKTQVVLPDGSKVWINAGSQIRYTSDFGKSRRELSLEGEAYMEVSHRADCPFVVSFDKLKVTVLGTQFNINAYKENGEIKVALIEGSIALEIDKAKPILLSPENLAVYNTRSKQLKILHQDAYTALNWIENKLIFDGETFEEIIRVLERCFNIEVTIHQESIKQRRFAGDFVKHETIEQIFNVMATDGKFNYAIQGNSIDIY